MGNFSTNVRGRCWIATVHIANMQNAGWKEEDYKNPEKLAEMLQDAWVGDKDDREAAVAVCLSADGCYHAHVALYGNTTTLRKVSKTMFNSHVEPQCGGKKELTNYMLKLGEHEEKGEEVLYTLDMDCIQDVRGTRSDLKAIEELLKQGRTPSEIMRSNFSYRKYEKMIRSEFIDIRMRETPLIKTDKECIWIVGESGTGKSYYYKELCEKYGEENVYFATDFDNGGMDYYIDQGAPEIFFMDEFKGNIRFSELLVILDQYSRAQIHCRYANCYCLWNKVIITSVYPPDEIYESLVEEGDRGRDKIEQLLRRLDKIQYRYKDGAEYKSFEIPTSEYTNYEDLKKRAHGKDNVDGFIETDSNPFEE